MYKQVLAKHAAFGVTTTFAPTPNNVQKPDAKLL
jgi:hypothetical protein